LQKTYVVRSFFHAGRTKSKTPPEGKVVYFIELFTFCQPNCVVAWRAMIKTESGRILSYFAENMAIVKTATNEISVCSHTENNDTKQNNIDILSNLTYTPNSS